MTGSKNLIRDVVSGELRYRTRFELDRAEQKVRDRIYRWLFLGTLVVVALVLAGVALAIYGVTR